MPGPGLLTAWQCQVNSYVIGCTQRQVCARHRQELWAPRHSPPLLLACPQKWVPWGELGELNAEVLLWKSRGVMYVSVDPKPAFAHELGGLVLSIPTMHSQAKASPSPGAWMTHKMA